MFPKNWSVYVGLKDLKKHFKLMKVNIKKFLWMHLQTNKMSSTCRIRGEADISLEITLNAFECLTVSLFQNPYFGNGTSFVYFVCVCTIFKSAILPIVNFLNTVPWERRDALLLLPEGKDVNIWQHIHQKDWSLC